MPVCPCDHRLRLRARLPLTFLGLFNNSLFYVDHPSSSWAAAEWTALRQGCQLVYFQTKNHNLCKFWSLWPFGIFCGHFGIFFPFWCIVPSKIWQPCLVYDLFRKQED
jgi:hypothetical protein